jgi:hypothetical protein
MLGAFRGGRSYALHELDDLPDEQLSKLIPTIRPDFSIHVDGDRMVARHAEKETVIDLCPATRENVLALNLFTGRITLGVAGRRLASQMAWPEDEGFAQVKEMFLLLVGRLMCVPRNTLPEQE